VQPTSGFAKIVKDRGGTVAVYNLTSTVIDDTADILFFGPCEEIILSFLSPRTRQLNM
ncbi:hypothetical protein DFS33DRAFT_1443677, partial [Desarmillaria ectypa]